MLRRLLIRWMASSTSSSPRAATCRSMPSAVTTSLLSRCLSEGLRIAFGVATLLRASPTPAQDEFAPVRELIQTCTACHGANGASTIPENPILAGQQYYYLYLQLKDFKSGARANEIMGPLAQTLQPDQMKLLAQFFSKQTWPTISHEAAPASVEPARRVMDSAGCIGCHLGDFRGASAVPRLASQHPEYLKRTMLAFKNHVRKNNPAMNALLDTFSDEELASVADYLASLTVHQGSQGSEIQ